MHTRVGASRDDLTGLQRKLALRQMLSESNHGDCRHLAMTPKRKGHVHGLAGEQFGVGTIRAGSEPRRNRWPLCPGGIRDANNIDPRILEGLEVERTMPVARLD